MNLAPPKTVGEVQSLNGKVVALNRFVLRAMDKCLPFFRTLKKSFEWMTKCQQAFEDLKAYLSSFTKPVQTRGRTVLIPNHLPSHCEHSFS